MPSPWPSPALSLSILEWMNARKLLSVPKKCGLRSVAENAHLDPVQTGEERRVRWHSDAVDVEYVTVHSEGDGDPTVEQQADEEEGKPNVVGFACEDLARRRPPCRGKD